MDIPSFRDEEDSQFLWVWDADKGVFVRRTDDPKGRPYPHRIDNDIFNPATQLEQPKNPLAEGIYAAHSGKCPECGAQGFADHLPNCSLGKIQNDYIMQPPEQYQHDPFMQKDPHRDWKKMDDSFPTMTGNVRNDMTSNDANLSECPDCKGSMVDRGEDKVCSDCGTKQPIVYASVQKTAFLPALLAMGARALPIVTGLMRGAMSTGVGRSLATHEFLNAIRPQAQPQQAAGVPAPTPQTTDIQSQLYSNTLPYEHIVLSYDVGMASPVNGDDVNPENDGQLGNQNRSGDSPELFKDQSGEAGGTDGLEALSKEFDRLQDYFATDKNGAEDQVVQGIHRLLIKTLPGYAEAFQREANLPVQMPGMPNQPNNFNNVSPTPNSTPGPCPICGQGHDAAHCPQASATPGAGMQQGMQPRMTYISPLDKIAARRPRMCPYHSDLTDYSLTLENPSAALTALQPNNYGRAWCKSGEYEGKCNFKPEFLKQEYWDAREEDARQRAELREEQQRLLDTAQPFDGDSGEPSGESGNEWAAENIENQLQGISPSPSTDTAVQGMPMAAKKSDFFQQIGNEPFDEDEDYPVSRSPEQFCPMCGTPNEPMGMLGQRTHYHCRNCGANYSDQDAQQQSPFAQQQGMYDDNAGRFGKTADNVAPWHDAEGHELQPGTYYMKAQNYSIPDKVEVLQIHPHKIDVVLNVAGRQLRKELTAEELMRQGFEFQRADDFIPDEPQQMRRDLEENMDSTTRGEPGEVTDLSAGRDAHEEPQMDDHPDRDWLKEDSAEPLVDPVLAKTAGRNFSQGEQRELINEDGSARNLDKLDLEGTHYTHPTNLDDYFALGM